MSLKEIIKSYNEKKRISFLKKETFKNDYRFEDVSILSSDCIGGILYHDLGAKFLSPTINLSFKENGFYYFVLNIKHYIASDITVILEDNKIIGKIGGNPLLTNCPDIYINFVHYDTIDEAKESWNSRKLRINFDKIRVICIEKNLSAVKLDLFNKINYRKIMIYGNAEEGIALPTDESFVMSKMIKKQNYRGELLVFKGIGRKRNFDDLKFDFLAFLQ